MGKPDNAPNWWKPGMRQRPSGIWEWKFYVRTPEGAKQVSAYGRNWHEIKEDRKDKERRYEIAPNRLRLNELLDRYLEYRAKQVNPRRLADDTSRIATYVRPGLGRLTLADLCTRWSIIEQHFEALSDDMPNSCTLQMVFDQLKAAFNYAIKQQLCLLNPCSFVTRPNYSSEEVEIFTLEDVLKLLELAQGQVRLMVFFWLATAARSWSEVLGLRVRDINFLRKEVYIRTFVTRTVNGAPMEKKPERGHKKAKGKNKRAVRTIPLIAPLVNALALWVQSKGLGPDDYVFPNTSGGLIREGNWRERKWKPLVEAVGRPDAHPYQLRHTCNSLLAYCGVDADTRAAICGHSEAVNRSVYTHIKTEAQRAALDKLEALLSGTDKGTDEGTQEATTAA